MSPRREADCGEGGLSHVFASRAAVPHPAYPVTVDSSSAIHLHEQSLLQGHTGHIYCRGGRKRCTPPTLNALTGASDNDCYKRWIAEPSRVIRHVQRHCRGGMRTAGGEILVSGTSPEIVPTRLSMAGFAIRRAHKSALEERLARAQISKFPDCQLLEHFLRAHVF